MTKAWKITISIIASILVLIMGFLAIYFLWPWNKTFFDNAKKEWEIPGLDTSFTPQGFSKIEGQDKYLISGYMSDGSASRFYVIDGKTGNAEKYFTLYVDDKEIDYCGHAGGIVSSGSSIWVVGDGRLFRFTLNDINNVNNANKVYVKAWHQLGIDNHNNADFAFTDGGKLYVGEFYREGNFETSKNNHLETRSGEINTAIVFGYTIDEQEKLGLDDTIPDVALSIRGLGQGMARTKDGKFILSTSYSIADSNIYYYDNVLSGRQHNTYRYGIHNVPLWYLDNEALLSTTNAPSMTEEIVVNNDNLYILFESGAKQYRLFNRKKLSNVYSLPISTLSK